MFNSIRGIVDRIKEQQQSIKEIKVENTGPNLVGPDALKIEQAKAEAMRELEEGDLFVLTPNDPPDEDVEMSFPKEIRYVFRRYQRIESPGAMSYTDYNRSIPAADYPGYTYIGEDMEEPLLVVSDAENIRIACGPRTFRENDPSIYHWILSVRACCRDGNDSE